MFIFSINFYSLKFVVILQDEILKIIVEINKQKRREGIFNIYSDKERKNEVMTRYLSQPDIWRTVV